MKKAFICLITLFFCFPSLAAEKPFKLGAALCISGGCAEWGGAALKGMELAAQEINKSGGIKGRQIKIIAEDTDEATSGKEAVSAFKKLLSDKEIGFIIGPSWTPAGMAMIPILSKESGVVVITPSMAVPDFPRAADNLFKTVPDNALTASHIADYAINKGYRRAAIFSNQLEAERYTSEVFAKAFEKLGGEVVILEETLPEDKDLKPSSMRIIQKKPDVVFLANYVTLGVAAKRLRNLGYEGPFVSILLDQTRISDGGEALEGTVFSKYVSYSKDFDEKFRKQYQEPYGPSADSAYDTVYLLKKAIEKADSFEPREVKKVLPTLEMQGTASAIKFNEFRTVEKPPQLFMVKNIKAVRYVN